MSDDVFQHSKQELAAQSERPSGRYGKVTRASDIRSRRQRWLIPNMIPLNTLTIFAGKGGEGKSTMVLDVAAKLSHGRLDGDIKEPASTLILSVEDDWETQMKPRLQAAGANLDYILKFDIETYFAESGDSYEEKPVLPMDTQGIAEVIAENNVKLIVFDPAHSFMTGDPNKGIDVRRSFEPISLLAQKLDVAALLIAHFNKGSGNVGSKLSGSHAWHDLTRSFWAFAKDEETGKRIFSQDKGNYSKDTGLSFEFDIVSTPVRTDEGDTLEYGSIAGIQSTDVTVDDIINREPDSDGSGRDECVAWLLSFLDQEPFEKPRRDVVKAARGEGFSERTLSRAKDEAGVGHHQSGFPASSFWTHPRITGSHSSGATGTTGENTNVSAGQNSYATVTPPNDTWHNSGITGLTRENASESPSYASHATEDTAEDQPPLQWGVNPKEQEQAS